MTIDVKKLIRYPPEMLLEAWPYSLTAGSNKVGDYVNFSPYYLVLNGLGFIRSTGLRFHADVDVVTEVFRTDDLGAAKGLDYEEDCKIPATEKMALYFTAPGIIADYQYRYKVMVYKPTTSMKVQLGRKLTPREEELSKKFELERRVEVGRYAAFDPRAGIEQIYTVGKLLSASGTVFKLAVPKDKKAIILDISSERPGAAAQAYVHLSRDGVDDVLKLDPYCMQDLAYTCPVRVVATDKFEITLELVVAGTYKVRAVYGLGRISIIEKIMWGIDLTNDEKDIAGALDLYDKVEAGMV